MQKITTIFTFTGQAEAAMNFYTSLFPDAFTFTPSMSLFVRCHSEAEIDSLYAKLSEGGAVLMALDNHGFSPKFAWVNDRFGVSWQLNLDAGQP